MSKVSELWGKIKANQDAVSGFSTIITQLTADGDTAGAASNLSKASKLVAENNQLCEELNQAYAELWQ